MSTFTTSKQLEQVANGADVGTWDVPENSNWGVVDACLGQIANVTLGIGTLILNAAQYQCNAIMFSGALTGNVIVTFPTTFFGPYTVLNSCTNFATFTVQLKSGAGRVICLPPGVIVDVFNGGSDMSFRNLPMIGTYHDFAGTTTPNWITGCSIPPYLNCDGSSFSAVTFPFLNVILGGTTLPDARGRSRFAMDQGTGRTSSVLTNSLLAGGGDQFLQSHTHTGATGNESAAHTHNFTTPTFATAGVAGGGVIINVGAATTTDVTNIENQNHFHGFTSDPSGTGSAQNIPPALNCGITMIRAG